MPRRGLERDSNRSEMIALLIWEFHFICPAEREVEVRKLIENIDSSKLQLHLESRPVYDGGSHELLGLDISGTCHPDLEVNILRTLLQAEVWTRIQFTTAQKRIAPHILVSNTHSVSIRPELRELLD